MGSAQPMPCVTPLDCSVDTAVAKSGFHIASLFTSKVCVKWKRYYFTICWIAEDSATLLFPLEIFVFTDVTRQRRRFPSGGLKLRHYLRWQIPNIVRLISHVFDILIDIAVSLLSIPIVGFHFDQANGLSRSPSQPGQYREPETTLWTSRIIRNNQNSNFAK